MGILVSWKIFFISFILHLKNGKEHVIPQEPTYSRAKKENVILTAQLVTKKKKRPRLDSLHSLDVGLLELGPFAIVFQP